MNTDYYAWGMVGFTVLCFGGLGWVLLTAFASGAEIYSGAYSEKKARQLADIFLFIPPRRIAEIGWAAAAGVTLLVFLFSGGISGSLTTVAVRLALCVAMTGTPMLLAPSLLLIYLRNRRRQKFNMQLVDALSTMGNALKSGFSIMQAISHVVENGENPLAQEFDTFLHQTQVGVSFSDALQHLDQRVGSEDLTLVIAAIETARKTGGNLTEIFEKIGATIRERIRIETRIQTLTAQGRLQGIIVGSMPLAIGIVLSFLQPGLFQPFITSMAGIVTIGVVVVLLVAGAFAIRKIVHIDV